MPKDDVKRIQDLAGKLALAGFGASIYERFESEELAAYCLEVAETIYAYDGSDTGDVEESEDDDD